jgi:hypothetical protein
MNGQGVTGPSATAGERITRRQVVGEASGGLLAAAGITVAAASERPSRGKRPGEDARLLPAERSFGWKPLAAEEHDRRLRGPQAMLPAAAPVIAGLPWYEGFGWLVERDGARGPARALSGQPRSIRR